MYTDFFFFMKDSLISFFIYYFSRPGSQKQLAEVISERQQAGFSLWWITLPSVHLKKSGKGQSCNQLSNLGSDISK